MNGEIIMWYVIQVMSGREHQMAERCKTQLLSANEEVFIPMYERKRKIKGEWKLQRAVLFPGYIFFSTENIEDVFYRLKEIKDFSKILTTGTEFTPIGRNEETFIRQFGGSYHIVEMSVGFIEGNEVTVTSGPMKNWSGKVKKIDRHKKLAVLEMDFFGRITDITVGLEIVEKRK